MSSGTLWCAAGGVWGGAAAFLAVTLCHLTLEVKRLRSLVDAADDDHHPQPHSPP